MGACCEPANVMVIAIDGPAGAGKSTVARLLAARLGFIYLDTGAMYRCVALRSLREPGVPPAALARAARIELATVGSGEPAAAAPGASPGAASHDCAVRREPAAGRVTEAPRVLLDGHDVTAEIRSARVSRVASLVAADPGVRDALVARQRELLAAGDWVAEGRDIATVVAPAAELKIYLTADPAERARRRAAELGADAATIEAEQALRDQRDSGFGRSTLQPAPGAAALDTTGLTAEQVVEQIVALARRRQQPA